MQTMMTVKGQVTIPKRIRDRLGLRPGAPVEFEANTNGDVVIRKPGSASKRRAARDRFEAATGAATIKWKSTAKIMSLLRPED